MPASRRRVYILAAVGALLLALAISMPGGTFRTLGAKRGAPVGTRHPIGHQTGGAGRGQGRPPGSKNRKRVVGARTCEPDALGSTDASAAPAVDSDGEWVPDVHSGNGEEPAAIFSNLARVSAGRTRRADPSGRHAQPGAAPAASPDEDSDDEDDDEPSPSCQSDRAAAEPGTRRDASKLPPSPGEMAYLTTVIGVEVERLRQRKVPTCYETKAGSRPSFWLRAPDPYFLLSEGAPVPELLEARDIFMWLPHLLVEQLRCVAGCQGRLGTHCACSAPWPR